MTAARTAVEMKNLLEGQSTAMMGVLLLNLGMELGVWERMRGGAPHTYSHLAQVTGLSERYLEELLRAATLHGYIQYSAGEKCDTGAKCWDSGVPRREGEAFSLSREMEEVLFDSQSPSYFGASLALPVSLTGAPYEKLLTAFHDDTGVPYSLYGGGKFGEIVEKQHSIIYKAETKDWMSRPELADMKERLMKGGVVLDLGCGSASSSIAMAKEFPNATIHAVDCDQASMDKAKINISEAEAEGIITPGQVTTHCCFAHEAAISPGTVDLVLVFISLHDMHNPSQVLASSVDLLSEGGAVLVLEFSAPDNFPSLMADGADPMQRGISTFAYSASVLHCLPVSKVETPSQAVGTQFSKPTMEVVAGKAGFSRVDTIKANDKMTMFVIKK